MTTSDEKCWLCHKPSPHGLVCEHHKWFDEKRHPSNDLTAAQALGGLIGLAVVLFIAALLAGLVWRGFTLGAGL